MADETGNLKETVLQYVRNEYLDEDDETELTYDTPLISAGIVDSFSMVSLKVFLEKKCNVQIPDAQATPEAFDTVNKIVALVQKIRGR